MSRTGDWKIGRDSIRPGDGVFLLMSYRNDLCYFGVVSQIEPSRTPGCAGRSVLVVDSWRPLGPISCRVTSFFGAQNQPESPVRIPTNAQPSTLAKPLVVSDITEAWFLQKQRLTQGKFREDVMSAWSGSCSVSGLNFPNLLIAAHIKPWWDCTSSERQDVENGLLLHPLLDKMFEAGLISLTSGGLIIWNPQYSDGAKGVAGFMPEWRELRHRPTEKMSAYLQDHRRRHGFQE
jgi:hypothetical protein